MVLAQNFNEFNGFPRAVTVIDDDPDQREELMDDLNDYNIEPVTLEGPYGNDIDRLIGDVMTLNKPFVICDHRLQTQNFSSFNGSRVIQSLIQNGQPAMLLTMYQSTNRIELRSSRADIPVVVGRDSFDIENLGAYAEVCRREIANDPVDTRRPHRTLISVLEVEDNRNGPTIYVDVPSWKPEHALILPHECVAAELLQTLASGDFLLGAVNIGAENEEELFFKNVDERFTEDELASI